MTSTRIVLLLIIVILSACLTGCWDMTTLEELNIPIAAGYDVVNMPGTDEKGIEVYGVFPVFFKESPKNYIIDITRGKLIGDTRSVRMEHMSEEINLGSFQVAIFGRNLAKEGVRDILDILLRSPQMKNTINLAVADGSLKDIFQFVPPNYPNIGLYLDKLLDSAYKSFIIRSNIYHFSLALDTPGWHPIAPLIKLEQNRLNISGYAIFEKDKLAHTVTITEARILSILCGLKSSERWTYDFVSKSGIPYSASVDMKNKAKVKVERNNTGYHIKVKINSKGDIMELAANKNLESIERPDNDQENLLKSKTLINEAEKGYEEYIKSSVEALVNKAQNEFEMDIFNWIKYAQAKWRKEIDKSDWDQLFSKADIKVEVKAVIEYVGEEV